MCLIKKLAHYDRKQANEFYRLFNAKLLEVFGQDHYYSEDELRMSFMEFMRDESYQEIINDILQDISPSDIPLTFDDITNLTPKRWKLCLRCGKPFLCYGNRNKSKTCYIVPYVRYRPSDTAGEGKFFKAVLDGYSTCFMRGRIEKEKRRSKRNKEKLVEAI